MKDIKAQIIKYFRPENHPTVDEIFNSLKEKFPDLDKGALKTYLDELEKSSKIKSLVDHQNKKHYHTRADRHFHFICDVCGKVKDITIEDGAVRMIQSHIQTKVNSYGRVNTINMSFSGPCHNCK